MLFQKTYLLSFKNFSAFLKNKSGSVAFLILGFTFIGIGLIGTAFDYQMYRNFKKKVQADVDSSIAAGGIRCREVYMRTKNFPDAKAAAHRETEDQLVKTPYFIPTKERNSSSHFNITVSKADATKDTSEGCVVDIEYDNKYKTSFSKLWGIEYFNNHEKSSAFANIDLVSSDIEIDFLIDVSSSMSTIANPRDRDAVMALSAITPNSGGGCIFLCHLRKALTYPVVSQRILDVAAGRITSDIARYGSAGQTTVNFPPVSRRPIAYTYNGPSPTKPGLNTGDNLISVGEMLDLFNIQLKTDLLYESVKKLIEELNATPDRTRIRVAFHRFSNQLETFVPKNQPNETQSLDTLSTNDLLPYHFEYGTMGAESSVFFYHGFFPSTNDNLTSLPLYAPPTNSSLTTGIPLFPTQNNDYDVINSRAYTAIGSIITQLRDKMVARSTPARRTQRIVVIITDGVKDENQTTTTAAHTRLYSPAICTPLKDEKAIVMVIHSYYRIQPGHHASIGLANILSGLPSITPNNVDTIEARINEEGLRDKFLLPCASPNPNPGPGEFRHYYFPGNDVTQLKQSFQKLLMSILNLDKNNVPVRIQH